MQMFSKFSGIYTINHRFLQSALRRTHIFQHFLQTIDDALCDGGKFFFHAKPLLSLIPLLICPTNCRMTFFSFSVRFVLTFFGYANSK